MAAVHHFETPHLPAKMRSRPAWLPWLKDAAAALGLVTFICACFVLADAFQGVFV